MSTIYIETNGDAKQVRQLVRSAIDGEIAKLQLALQLAHKRLLPFEEKYNVLSAHFNAEMTVEDLTGGDDEYVRWAGEYRLMERLQSKLQKLREVEFSDSGLLQSNQIPD